MFDLDNLKAPVRSRIEPFLSDVFSKVSTEDIASVYVVGSSVTPDFTRNSDTNTLFIIQGRALDFVKTVAPLGKRYGRKKVRAPLVMTDEYIQNSLDVFPVEFLDLRTVNSLVYGPDRLAELTIDPANLRLQCERELKGRLVSLRQGYTETAGNEKLIRRMLEEMLSSFIPVFRGLLFLRNKSLSTAKAEVISSVGHSFEMDMSCFHTILSVKKGDVTWARGAGEHTFEGVYAIVEELSNKADLMEGDLEANS